MPYIDGFVIAVPTANKQKFIDHALRADSVFIDFPSLYGHDAFLKEIPLVSEIVRTALSAS